MNACFTLISSYLLASFYFDLSVFVTQFLFFREQHWHWQVHRSGAGKEGGQSDPGVSGQEKSRSCSVGHPPGESVN